MKLKKLSLSHIPSLYIYLIGYATHKKKKEIIFLYKNFIYIFYKDTSFVSKERKHLILQFFFTIRTGTSTLHERYVVVAILPLDVRKINVHGKDTRPVRLEDPEDAVNGHVEPVDVAHSRTGHSSRQLDIDTILAFGIFGRPVLSQQMGSIVVVHQMFDQVLDDGCTIGVLVQDQKHYLLGLEVLHVVHEEVDSVELQSFHLGVLLTCD